MVKGCRSKTFPPDHLSPFVKGCILYRETTFYREVGVLKMSQKVKNIVIIGTLDTKGEEMLYLKELILRRGHHPMVMDVGTSGRVSFQPDFTREEVALATGQTLQEILATHEKYTDALTAMAMGAKSLIQKLIAEKKIDGLLSIGGALGTTQTLMIMRELPLSVPKLSLSTVAFIAELITSEVVSIDQAMIQSIADLWGLNRITKMALQRAAGAICGMVEEQEEKRVEEKPLIAISALGVHTYVDQCKSLLMEKGYEPVVFHSVGTGALEKLIRQGYINGVLDLACYELINFVSGGPVKGGEEKFTAACEEGIPQVIAPGALDFFPWPLQMPFPDDFKNRTMNLHSRVNLIKTTPQEQEKAATLLAEKINKARAPTIVLVPLGGFSRLDRSQEMPFYDPGAGKRFANVLKEKVSNPFVEIEEMEVHINDPAFAERATTLLLDKMA
jgi:uncharacterized protein (UPF0261 family)